MEGEGREGGVDSAAEGGRPGRPGPDRLLHTPSQAILSLASGTRPPHNLHDFLRLEPGKQIPENPQ